MSDLDVAVGLSTQTVSRLAGVPSSTLDYWVRLKLVRPSVRPPDGRRVARYWSVQDLVVVRTIRTLRDAGCSLQGVRKVKAVIEDQWQEDLSSVHVYWDGSDVRAVKDWNRVISLLDRPNQEVLHLVSVPVEAWASEATDAAEEIDLAEIRERRKKRKRATRQAAPPRSLDPAATSAG